MSQSGPCLHQLTKRKCGLCVCVCTRWKCVSVCGEWSHPCLFCQQSALAAKSDLTQRSAPLSLHTHTEISIRRPRALLVNPHVLFSSQQELSICTLHHVGHIRIGHGLTRFKHGLNIISGREEQVEKKASFFFLDPSTKKSVSHVKVQFLKKSTWKSVNSYIY